MDYQTILVSVSDDGATYITLNRPDVRNAFNAEMIAELTHAIQQAEEDSNTSAVVLAANGKHFSAGADLNWMKSMAGMSYDENCRDAAQLATLMQTLYQCAKPTVARIQGCVFGGAVGLVSCCDIAIATEDARFCLSEVKLGLVPAVISPYVINAIGARQASRYFLTAEVFTSTAAKSIGLIHEITHDNDLESTTAAITQNLVNTGPAAVKAAKKLIQTLNPIDSPEIIEHTTQLIATLRVSEEGQEGITAFLEKRSPNWKKN